MAKSAGVPGPIRIMVVGLGGAGCNTVTRMVSEHIAGIDFIAINTDTQNLGMTEAPERLAIGQKLTKGRGAGGDFELGKKCAEASRNEIQKAVTGADMVFLVAGMGGGTGTGALPVVADIARQNGALTIAIVTKPFTFEGKRRARVAEEGISQLKGKADTVIIIPNDRLLRLSDKNTSIAAAFRYADEIISHAIQVVTDLITVPGLINIDFAGIRKVMKDSGSAWMSVGNGSGQNGAANAAREALASPLLDVSISGAKAVLYRITGGSDLSLLDVNNAARLIQQAVTPAARIIFGVSIDPNMGTGARLTLIATGFAPTSGVTFFGNELRG